MHTTIYPYIGLDAGKRKVIITEEQVFAQTAYFLTASATTVPNNSMDRNISLCGI
ncbi:MAG: hypothetical protein R2794_12760 [Chitinophagales bacterium]